MAKKPKAEVIGAHTDQLMVGLNSEELLDRGARLAQLQSDLAQHEMHADAVKKDLKSAETNIQAEISRYAGIVRRKSEPRPIKVEHLARWDTLMYEEIRTDTGEVIPGTVRPLREEERQSDFMNETKPSMDEALAKTEADNAKAKKAKKTIGKKKAKADEEPAPAA